MEANCLSLFRVSYHNLFVLITDHQLASTDLDTPCQILFEVADERLQCGGWCDPTLQIVYDVIRF